MKQLFLLAVTALMLSSCGSDLVSVAIDNPTNDYVIVAIDSLVVEVPPREVAWAEMGKGIHKITADGSDAVDFDFQSEVYMLNPTLSEYLLYEEVYGASQFGGDGGGTLPNKTIEYMGVELEGRYDVVRDLVNPVTWEYGPREVTPEMIEMDADQSFAYVSKLADINEVLSMMGSE